MSFRWTGIKYPTPFVFRWCSKRTNTERRGQPVRQLDFDQKGGANFEFKDGFRVYESQNAVQFLTPEIRMELIGSKRKNKFRFSPSQEENMPPASLYVPESAKLRKARKRKELIKMAEAAGIKVKKTAPYFRTGNLPHEVHAAVKYAASLRGVQVTQWLYEAIREKLNVELLTPDSKENMAVKAIGRERTI